MIDGNNIEYVENTLKAYQYLTEADTSKLSKVIGDYEFINLENWLNAKLKK